MTGSPWHETPLVALDLEGSGAQDRDKEVILEIATVPIVEAEPDVGNAYCTLLNPGRPVPARPWISPGLTNETLRSAPALEAVGPALAERINGRYIVGHNVGVDWRLLHRRCPNVHPAGLIDTLRLARHLNSTIRNGLTHLVAAYDLTAKIDNLALGSQPHRALWDAIAAAALLGALVERTWPNPPTLEQLNEVAGTRLEGTPQAAATDQPSLFDT